MATVSTDLPQRRSQPFTATRNACKLCAPLGACLAFRGVEGAVPFLHGSQGCSTYIRRYLISHFKEPVDIACSNFGEDTAIFGGERNLRVGLQNVIRQYKPQLIGIATTCLSETIGDDVQMFLHQIRKDCSEQDLPPLVHVATPSYAGSHAEGFHHAVQALVQNLAETGPPQEHINLFPGLVSPSDIRHLKEVVEDFGLEYTLAPDYSDTLDGPIWEEYRHVPPGGTPVDSLRRSGAARATLEFGCTWDRQQTAGAWLERECDVPRFDMPLPIGVCLTDQFFETLEQLTGRPTPPRHEDERGRLIDAMVDAHKYVSGKSAVLYGEPDLVVGLAALLAEIGVIPVLCGTGVDKAQLRDRIATVAPDVAPDITALEGIDFAGLEEHCDHQRIDLVVGNSKGFKLARKLGVPLVRVGFPVHDRVGGPRLMHLGYRGAQQVFDRIANALIEAKQASSDVGYTYM